jgi:dTDP-glucose 4,6-dehydratase
MSKILLTGSCGFIGSQFVRQMIYEQNQTKDKRHSFCSIDRVNSNSINAIYSNKGHKFYPADIRDQHVMDIIFQTEKPDYVIHLAAESSVDKSLNDPNSFVSSNVLGTQVIINCCVKHKVKKLLYTSTDEVMGQLTNEQEKSWTEEDIPNPRNPYSGSKYCAEILVKAAHTTHGLTYNITRSSNCYGPRQLPDKLIPRTIKCILNQQKVGIYGQGKEIRDWTFVGDHCSALMTVLEKGEPNSIYNISANQEFSNLEVVHEICQYMKTGHNLVEFVKDPRGNAHDFRYSVNSSKLRALGWKPTVQFKKDLGDVCVRWYLDNSFWFQQ